MYTYFERPRTVRDSHRVPPTIESEMAAGAGALADQAQRVAIRADVEANARAEALDGAAGRQSTAANTAWQVSAAW